jgi:hypothetical protein
MTLPTLGRVTDLAWHQTKILVLVDSTLFRVNLNGSIDKTYGGGDGQVPLGMSVLSSQPADQPSSACRDSGATSPNTRSGSQESRWIRSLCRDPTVRILGLRSRASTMSWLSRREENRST